MATKKTPRSCTEDQHSDFMVNLFRFLASTDYVGIQERIAPDPPAAVGRCRKCHVEMVFPLNDRQCAQLLGKKATRQRRADLPDPVVKTIVKLAKERTPADKTFWHNTPEGPKYSYRAIGKKLVELALVEKSPDPAIIRRIVVAAHVER